MQSTQSEVKINNKKVDNGLNEDLKVITSFNSGKMTPFTELFWEQQKRLFTLPSYWVCHHPVIIRFSLYVPAKSPSA